MVCVLFASLLAVILVVRLGGKALGGGLQMRSRAHLFHVHGVAVAVVSAPVLETVAALVCTLHVMALQLF